MLIDKSKFLMMVTALSAATSACIVNGGGTDGNNGGSASTGDTTTTTTATGSTTTGVTSSTASGTGGTGGSACLDDSSDQPACSSTCEGATNCNVMAYLKGEVAVDCAACLNALNPATCGQADIQTCLYASLGAACYDTAETQPICAQLAIDCGVVDDAAWEDPCQARLDGLNTAGRTAFQTCMTDSCAEGGTADLDACAMSLFL